MPQARAKHANRLVHEHHICAQNDSRLQEDVQTENGRCVTQMRLVTAAQQATSTGRVARRREDMDGKQKDACLQQGMLAEKGRCMT